MFRQPVPLLVLYSHAKNCVQYISWITIGATKPLIHVVGQQMPDAMPSVVAKRNIHGADLKITETIGLKSYT